METGIHPQMNDKEYFAVDAASNSTIGKIKKSPAHCKAYIEADDKEPTPALIVGRLIHCLALDPSIFNSAFIVKPEGINRRTNKGKEEWADFIELAGKRDIVTNEQIDEAKEVVKSIHAHPAARAILDSPGMAEVACFWTDEETGLPCKSKYDYLTDSGYIIDLKTTIDASLAEFSRSIAKYGYHRQNAMYADGYEAAFNKPPKGFVFIAVEKEPPYAVGVYVLDEEGQSKGFTEYRELLLSFAECKRSDNWPAYSEQVEEINLPAWYK